MAIVFCLMTDRPYPLLFSPVYKEYIWGGGNIGKVFNRSMCPQSCAESWELSDRPDGMSIVSNGPLAGRSLNELIAKNGTDLTGISVPKGAFPLLVKLIDAKQRLSVQVHPDEPTARAGGGNPKTEMWYVLSSAAGAGVFAGVKEGSDRKSFEKAIAAGGVEKMLQFHPVSPGSVIYLPGGTVHAICEGCLLLEIQQNSNTTYRLFDWNRLDRNGKPRELHVEKGLNAVNWKNSGLSISTHPLPKPSAANSEERLVQSPYFNVKRLCLGARYTAQNDGSSFHAYFTVSGKLDVEGPGFCQKVETATAFLMPAAIQQYSIVPRGNAVVIGMSLC